jgi:hypothetical protein
MQAFSAWDVRRDRKSANISIGLAKDFLNSVNSSLKVLKNLSSLISFAFFKYKVALQNASNTN